LVSEGISQFTIHLLDLTYGPGGLIRAINLVFLLGRYSYTTLPGLGPTIRHGRIPYSDYKHGDQIELLSRPSDSQLDNLLLGLLRRAKNAGKIENLDLKETAFLKAEIEYLAEFDIMSYFKQSYPLMLGWAP